MRLISSLLAFLLAVAFSLGSVSASCNGAQMRQALEGYAAGTAGDLTTRTGYDFSGSYPFFNCSTADSVHLEVVDLEDLAGCDVIKGNLAGYPAWIGQVYGTKQTKSIDYFVDEDKCFGLIIIKRDLEEYVYGRSQLEVFDVKVFFGDNTRSRRGRGNSEHDGDSHRLAPGGTPDVLINRIVESNNGGSLQNYLFDYFFDDAVKFCGKFIQYCSASAGWATFQDCVNYNSRTLFTVSPTNNFIPYGDTRSCRNYFMARRIAGQVKFGATQDDLDARCAAIGPADGNPARFCHW